MNKPIDASNAFKLRDSTSYDAVSESFANFTTRFSQPIAARMVALAKVNASDHVLDVGTGTGVVALAAARQLGVTGRVTGIDLSAGMLTTARQLAALESAGTRISWQSMDAEALIFGSNMFDSILSLFALLHFPNPLAALREMQRVVKPGGRLVIALGSRHSLVTVAGVVHALETLPSLLRRRTGRELVAPAFLDALVHEQLPRSNGDEQSALAEHSSARAGSVQQLVQEAGFTEIAADWVGYNHKIDTAEEFWELQRTFSSLARKRINEAPTEKVKELQETFMATCHRVLARGGKLVYPVGVQIIGARKPAAV